MTIIISIKSDKTTASGAEIRDGHRDGCILGVGDATAEGLACAGFVVFGTSRTIKRRRQFRGVEEPSIAQSKALFNVNVFGVIPTPDSAHDSAAKHAIEGR
ncbi:hypothetical protein C8J35_107118 [Rhizobium sp. PP-F2F-G38]|uniref:hypothetical protein n=1 Tax=Rhizobium sp. PP-CC-3G-465 TaxID=2135648 RepID=UPI000D999CEE|nr:hypothetical protein C8J37_107117 [Rhizobium sp. PP-WC-1G-195]PYE95959.1 hypothetical protein C8J35_107118 [Rhizobium sp. PP-F2F-G38]TCP88436.1 hypothetical protein C8J31_103289 [Rhizobium sp. PP-CC-2G-626]TCQ22899.1 hypothetical protein C8J33_105118 [Rhizobium sp. PP-CC-3G-465]